MTSSTSGSCPTTTWRGPSAPFGRSPSGIRHWVCRATGAVCCCPGGRRGRCGRHGPRPRARSHARLQRGRPAVRHADLRGRPRGRGRLPRHGDEPVAASRDRAAHPVGVKLGDEQFAQADAWEAEGRLALVGIGVEPGLSDVFARYAADHLFSEIDELGTRDGANLAVHDDDGNESSRRASRSGRRSRSASTRRSSGRRSAAGSRPSRSASRRSSSSRRASGPSSASMSSTRKCCSCRAGSTPGG